MISTLQRVFRFLKQLDDVGVFFEFARCVTLVSQVRLRIQVTPQHSDFLDGEEIVVGEALNFVNIRVGAVVD